LKIKETLKL